MKINKGFLIVILFTISFSKIFAQNDADALRYSMLNYGSTARSLAMGNSFGALGADLSTLATNPAGVALFRHNEVSLSPLFSNRTTDASYRGESNRDNSFKFAFGNFGAVFVAPSENPSNIFKSWSFGIGYTKLNDFNTRSVASGINLKHSLADNWLEQLDGVSPSSIDSLYPFDVSLGWDTYLIDTVSVDSQLYYFNAIPYAGVRQTRTVETRGNQGEWDFSLGTNVDNRLFLGMTLGLTTLRYEEQSTWEEKDIADTIPYFTSFRYNQNLTTTGTGFNIKFGGIYKINDALRIGASIHTPTWMTLTDNYSSNIRTDLQDGQIRSQSSPVYLPFQYSLNTPFRAMGSFAVIVNKNAAMNFEYEFIE